MYFRKRGLEAGTTGVEDQGRKIAGIGEREDARMVLCTYTLCILIGIGGPDRRLGGLALRVCACYEMGGACTVLYYAWEIISSKPFVLTVNAAITAKSWIIIV